MNVKLSINSRRPIAARDCEEPLPASIWRWRPDPIPLTVEALQDSNAANPKTGSLAPVPTNEVDLVRIPPNATAASRG